MYRVLVVLSAFTLTIAQNTGFSSYRYPNIRRPLEEFAFPPGRIPPPLILRPTPPPDQQQLTRTYSLCTYSNIEFTKCIHTVHVSQNNSIDLPLNCVQKDTREDCLEAARLGHIDLVIIGGHGYGAAREKSLKPVLYGKESDDSVYIAVVPRDITAVQVFDAPLFLNDSIHRAFHAAVYFNLKRGHDICRLVGLRSGPVIKIVDSAEYTPTDDEILLCINRTYAEASEFRSCNYEASLERAVFTRRHLGRHAKLDIQNIFNTILEHFSADSPQNDEDSNLKNFNFFSEFEGQSNILFKDNTISFELKPTYRNGVTEEVFNQLHCNADDQPHDPSQLE